MSNPPRDDRTRYAPSSNEIKPSRDKRPGDFDIGEIIAGSYRVLSFIGRGGMGAVYRVHHIFLDKEMALKTLTGDQITETAWKRFQIEGQAIARLDHPNIIRIYDLGITGANHPYYVMELVEGQSLGELLQERGVLPVDYALPIFRQVATGLAYAHEHGIVHRDLKPVNIMLLANPKSDIPVAKVLDFGLAKLTDLAGGAASGLTRTGEVFGSPLYMSPEQAQGLPVGPPTDIYSFGCSLFEALTGSVPLKGGSAVETMMMHQSKEPPRLSDVRPDLKFSPELENLMRRLLAKRPEARSKSFSEIAGQLLQIERPQNVTLSGFLDNPRNQIREEADDPEDEYTTPPSTLTAKSWFLPLCLGGAAVLLLIVGGTSYYLLTPRSAGHTATVKPAQPTPAPVSVSSSVSPSSNDDGETVAGLKPYSHLETIDGKQMRVFDFGDDGSLGNFTYDLDQEERARFSSEWAQTHSGEEENPFKKGFRARGKVITNTNMGLIFKPDENVCNTPQKFKRFKTDDLVCLDLSGNEFVNSDFLPYIKHLKNLRGLIVSETDVDDKALKVIESLPELEFLRIDHTKISGSELAKSQILKKLQRFSFSAGTELGPVLAALRDNASLKELRLDSCTLTKDDLQNIAAIPNLTKLDLNDSGVGDTGLKYLVACKSLKKLVMRDDKLTPASIPTFTKMHLTKATLSEQNWTPADCLRLKVALSKLPQYCELDFRQVGI